MSDWTIIHTLYECQNLTKAAGKLFLTQPTLTKRLQLIEEELGVTVAVRTKKGIQFTAEGEYLAAKSAQMISLMDEIQTHLASIHSDTSGSLNIGATNSMTRSSLPDIILNYQLKHPNQRIQITTERSSRLVKLVEQGKLDLAFINGEVPFSGEKILFRREQAYLASATPLDMNELEKYTYITYTNDPYTRRILEDWWYQDFSTPYPSELIMPHADLCREMVLKGLGYSILFVKEYMSGHYECLQPVFYKNGTPLTRNTWLIYTKKAKRTPLFRNS